MGKIRIKRKHTEDHPAVYARRQGHLRNEVLKFIYDKGCSCDFHEYSKFMKEVMTKHKLNYNPTYWYSRFPKYLKKVSDHNGTRLKLTRIGKNLVELVLNEE